MITAQQRPALAPVHEDPRARYIDVTPSFARKMLAPEINSCNRKIIPSAVAFYADAMEHGEWAITGEAIQFAGQIENQPTLLGGQHRLEAVAQTGITQRMLVVDGLDPTVYAVLDTGKPHGFRDVLSAMGQVDAAKVAAAARLAYLAEHDLLNNASGSTPKISNLRLQEWITYHVDFTSYANEAGTIRHAVPMNASAALVALWTLSQIDKNAAGEFFDGIKTGANLGTGDARLTLRNWFIRNGSSERAAVHLAMTYKAWNGFRQGRDVKTLRWSPAAPTRELFPKPAA
jgi:hypothetical protein